MGGYDEYAISDDVEIVQVQCAFNFYPGKKFVSQKKVPNILSHLD